MKTPLEDFLGSPSKQFDWPVRASLPSLSRACERRICRPLSLPRPTSIHRDAAPIVCVPPSVVTRVFKLGNINPISTECSPTSSKSRRSTQACWSRHTPSGGSAAVPRALSPLALPPPFLHLRLRMRRFDGPHTNECRRDGFGHKMEVLSLSLSRLQVLWHSLSKVLFKLSLTLLVCYRSSHSVFNLGRHIPAT
jgi:hypothetical protein